MRVIIPFEVKRKRNHVSFKQVLDCGDAIAPVAFPEIAIALANLLE
ncbi:hypothetical protein [Calothrix sp. 336/3]|nr:hypothetical protein [Calothrix sp. 336/3]